jgi:signal transduction histidine kinase
VIQWALVALLALLLAAITGLFFALNSRKKTRERAGMLKAGEQELLERLAAGLAHELKNPLGALNLNLQLLAEELGDPPAVSKESQDRLALIMKEMRRLEEVLDNFLRYARKRPLALAPLSIDDVISDVLTFLKPETRRSGIEVETQFDPDLPPLRGDHSLIKQALLNVILNAVEAMVDGGRLTVTTGSDGGNIRVRVSDTGGGIDPGDLPRVYDAYFSTRKGGTGLGLAITRRIIERHGGTITLESNADGGTTAVIVLPAAGPVDAA